MKTINPFVGRMPRELHEQYMTDFLTEFVETEAVETKKNTADGVVFYKYRFIVAFARKTWKHQTSISSRHIYDAMCKYDPSRKLGWQQYTVQYNQRKPRTLNSAHSSCVEKEILHAYTKQCTESYVNIYLCIFLFQIIIHIQVVTEIEKVGWIMVWTVCAVDYILFMEK